MPQASYIFVLEMRRRFNVISLGLLAAAAYAAAGPSACRVAMGMAKFAASASCCEERGEPGAPDDRGRCDDCPLIRLASLSLLPAEPKAEDATAALANPAPPIGGAFRLGEIASGSIRPGAPCSPPPSRDSSLLFLRLCCIRA